MTRSLFFAALLASAVAARALAASAAPEILELDGRLGGRERLLAKGDSLKIDAPFWVSKGGRAVLRVPGGVVQIKGPAHFVPRADGFTLKLGGLLSVLSHLNGQRWQVRTPAAVAAVRGTWFYVEAEKGGGTYLCLCKGALEITAAGKTTEAPTQIKAEHHAEFDLRTEAGHLVKTPAGMKNHSDAEVEALRKFAN